MIVTADRDEAASGEDGILQAGRSEQVALSEGGPVDLLLVPWNAELNDAACTAAAHWAEAASAAASPATNASAVVGTPSLQVRIYGTFVACGSRRAVILSAADRLQTARDAVVRFLTLQAELSAIEAGIGSGWPEYEADLPLAGGMTAADAPRLEEVRARYSRVMSLAARLVRLTPQVHEPVPHPPTLAGQLGERLRDRARLAHRLEAADDQVDLLAQHYDACCQRASDFTISQRDQVLSWTIIVLLAVETVLLLMELLLATGS
jgi:hypothetical protein